MMKKMASSETSMARCPIKILQESDFRYIYYYDGYYNWTERSIEHREGAFVYTTTVHRKLTYY